NALTFGGQAGNGTDIELDLGDVVDQGHKAWQAPGFIVLGVSAALDATLCSASIGMRGWPWY
ncbi:TPA: hypothetical protein ACNVV3_003820, partial [Pseudomonas putida]